MTTTEFAAYVRYKTRSNATTFPDAEMLSYMNRRLDELAQDILKVDEKILLVPQTDDLVANQREYSLPSDTLARLERIEAKLDGSNFIKLDEAEPHNISHPLDETNITNNFSNLDGEAKFFISRNAIYILSGTITSVTNGLKIWVNTWPAAISALNGSTDMSVDPSTSTHGIPRALHEILARGVIIDFKESKEKPIPLSEREIKYDVDKLAAIQTLGRAYLDRDIIGYLPAEEYRGNEGYDY